MRGTISFTANVFGEAQDIALNNTLHFPALRTNLLSVGEITKNGFEVLFQRDNALVSDTDGNVKLIANRVSDLYYVCERANFE